MDKTQILSFIQNKLAEGAISESEVLSLMHKQQPAVSANQTVSEVKEESTGSSRRLVHVFYAIGGIIVLVGVGILIAQHWNDIGVIGRLGVTLGIGLLTYMSGLLLRGPENRVLSQVMFTISGALAPVGAFVFLDENNIRFDEGVNMTLSVSLAIIYGMAYIISKRSILIVFTAGFSTWAYYAVYFLMFGEMAYDSTLYLKWATIILGITYILIGYGFKSMQSSSGDSEEDHEKKRVASMLYAGGTLAILGAGITLGGIFDLIYILVIFAAFYTSVWLHSRSMLLFASMFLMGHIVKLTSEYFVDSIGWPVALIGVGFIVIAIGYGTYYVNKKYMSTAVRT